MTKTFIAVDMTTRDAERKLQSLQGQFRQSAQNIKSGFGDRVNRSLGKVGALLGRGGPIAAGAAIATGAVAGIGYAFQRVATEMDRVAKQSRRLGVTTETLIGLRHAADQSGVSVSQMEMALTKIQKRSIMASEGNKELARGFEAAGINLDTFLQLTPAEKMERLADAISGVEDPSERVRRSMQLLGDEAGVAMITMLEGGSEALRAYQREAEELGLTVGSGTTKEFEAFNDSLDVVGKAFKGVGLTIAEQFAPAMAGLAETAEWVAKKVGKWLNVAIEFWSDLFHQFVAFEMNAGKRFQVFFARLEGLWAGGKLAAAKGINAIVEFTLGGINALIRQFGRLFEAMPERVQKFLGIDPSGWEISTEAWTIDTSGLEADVAMAGQTLADTLASEGAGDRYYKRYKESLKRSTDQALAELPDDDTGQKAADAGKRIANKMNEGFKKGRLIRNAFDVDPHGGLGPQEEPEFKVEKEGRGPPELSPWQEYHAKVTEIQGSIQRQGVDAVSAFSSGIGNALAQSIQGAKSLDQAFANMAQTVAAQVVGSLVSLGVQLLIVKAIGTAANTAAVAAATGSMAAVAGATATTAASIAAAWGPAATAASIATLGGAAGIGLAAYLTALTAGTAATVAAQGVTTATGALFGAVGSGAGAASRVGGGGGGSRGRAANIGGRTSSPRLGEDFGGAGGSDGRAPIIIQIAPGGIVGGDGRRVGRDVSRVLREANG